MNEPSRAANMEDATNANIGRVVLDYRFDIDESIPDDADEEGRKLLRAIQSNERLYRRFCFSLYSIRGLLWCVQNEYEALCDALEHHQLVDENDTYAEFVFGPLISGSLADLRRTCEVIGRAFSKLRHLSHLSVRIHPTGHEWRCHLQLLKYITQVATIELVIMCTGDHTNVHEAVGDVLSGHPSVTNLAVDFVYPSNVQRDVPRVYNPLPRRLAAIPNLKKVQFEAFYFRRMPTLLNIRPILCHTQDDIKRFDLSFDGLRLDDACVGAVRDMLHEREDINHYASITDLSLQHCDLPLGRSLQDVCSKIDQSRLQVLNLGSCPNDLDFYVALSNGLKRSKIKKLALSMIRNGESPVHSRGLSLVLCKLPQHLDTLRLKYYAWDKDVTQKLCEYLVRTKSLETLELISSAHRHHDDNCEGYYEHDSSFSSFHGVLDDKACHDICTAITSNRSTTGGKGPLMTLELRGSMTLQGIVQCSSLIENAQLKEVTISFPLTGLDSKGSMTQGIVDCLDVIKNASLEIDTVKFRLPGDDGYDDEEVVGLTVLLSSNAPLAGCKTNLQVNSSPLTTTEQFQMVADIVEKSYFVASSLCDYHYYRVTSPIRELKKRVEIISRLNENGRKYLIEQNETCEKTEGQRCKRNRSFKEKGVSVLAAVADDLDCLYFHLRENPRLCQNKKYWDKKRRACENEQETKATCLSTHLFKKTNFL